MRFLSPAFQAPGLLGLGSYVMTYAATAVLADKKTACVQLADTLHLKNTTILSVSHVPANSTVSTAGSCQSSATVSSNLCRVYAQVNTTSTSMTKFEIWLPDEYHGRFITVGNGGLGGCTFSHQLDNFSFDYRFGAM
jgi:feruloyl esterase